MTHRQIKLIDDRAFLINKINEAGKVDPERTAEILNKYRIETVYQTSPEIYQYLPDAILETIVTELEGNDGK